MAFCLRQRLAIFTLLLAGLATFMLSATTRAHEVRPAIAEITYQKSGQAEIAVRINAEALLAGIGPEHSDTDDAPSADLYRELRGLTAADLAQRFAGFGTDYAAGITLSFDGAPAPLQFRELVAAPVGDTGTARESVARLTTAIPAGAENVTFAYAPRFGDVAVKQMREGDTEPVTEWLTDGKTGRAMPLSGAAPEMDTWTAAVTYVEQGFLHIIPLGIDHILFVLGLFLLSTAWRPLLVQVTTFTIAHSITLAASLYGVVSLSPAIVEPLIALSIAYVAVENIFKRDLSTWRPFVVFAFGLLHGLGFAGVLTELGLPESQFLTALISFNIGVEIGQISVIAVAFLVVGLWGRNTSWYRPLVVIPASCLIAFTGLYWTVTRIAESL